MRIPGSSEKRLRAKPAARHRSSGKRTYHPAAPVLVLKTLACSGQRVLWEATRPRLHNPQGETKMAKLTKATLFKPAKSGPESVMDKTSRVVREIQDEETNAREARTSRLRKARLERENGKPSAKSPKSRAKTTG